jgi:hypothetical protein
MQSLHAAFAAALLGAALAAPAAARDIFSGTFTVDGQTVQAGTNNASDFADLLTNAGLNSLFANYTITSAATVNASLRGVPATLSYLQGSTTLRLQVPSAGVDESFTGGTRDASQDLAIEWLKGAGGSALTRVLQQAVATTSLDPVAGNPNSLMSTMGASDFNNALGGGATAGRSSFGARFGSYTAEGFNSDVYSLPLATSFNVEGGGAVVLDLPLTFATTEGAQSYSGSFGVGYRAPIRIGLPESLSWTLTPMLRAGAVGSVDLGAVGGMWSVSVTSVLDWRVRPGTAIKMGNMVSRLQTLPISYAGYSASYELTNYMFRNGLVLSQDVGELFGRQVQASAFAVDTRFTGDALYVSNYQEYGAYLSFGMGNVAGRTLPLAVGVTVLQGERGYRGFSLNLGMSF